MDFIRRCHWYKGKTNYRPPVVMNTECGGFEYIKLPHTNFLFKRIDAKDIVQVQSMKFPSSLVFYEEFKHNR